MTLCGEKMYVLCRSHSNVNGSEIQEDMLRTWGLMGTQGINTDFCWGYSLEVQEGARKVTV
jgi:hypothetical protein